VLIFYLGSGLEITSETLAGLEQLHSFFGDLLEEKLKKNNVEGRSLPRVLRLATKLDLTTKETRAMQFILLSNVGKDFPPPPSSLGSSLDMRTMCHYVANFANLSAREMLEFLRPSRLHMKQVKNLWEGGGGAREREREREREDVTH